MPEGSSPDYTGGVKIRIGTSGYAYKDWVGPVYPEGCRQADFFDRYREIFDFTELNFSYYAFPVAKYLAALQKKAGDDFRFALKAHRSMTHEASENLPGLCSRFVEALEPFSEAGTLASVLLQFPYSFHYTRENRLKLDKLCAGLEAVPLHVEFRNTDWSSSQVAEGLRSRGVGLVASDYPDLKGLPGFTSEVTSPVAYARFHGRNSKNWWKGTNVSRYDYRYSTKELTERVPILKEMGEKAQVLLVAFNNHYKGQAVDNALELKGLLEGQIEPTDSI